MRTDEREKSKERPVPIAEMNRLEVLFRPCAENAHDLLREARILGDAACYARGTFLALSAYEEMGKAQLVADYANNCVSASEFRKAFSDHRMKAAYMMRQVAIETRDLLPNGRYAVVEGRIVYDRRQSLYQVQMREKALYVSCNASYAPVVPFSITKDEFEYVMERVGESFEEIENAQWLNPQIGSKALFK
jgi:AbiV family abortive infection protein